MAREDAERPLLDKDGQGATQDDTVLGTPITDGRPSNIIWEGTTWQGCPPLLMCCTPLLCSTWQWKISRTRIDLIHGFCSSDEETIDLRRVVDLHFHRNFFQLLTGRGTITIHSASDEFPELHLTTFGTRQIFTDLREAWTQAKVGTAVGYDEHHSHV